MPKFSSVCEDGKRQQKQWERRVDYRGGQYSRSARASPINALEVLTVAYLGNLNGPKESEIVQKLGHEYFGITPAQLAADVELWEESERDLTVVPVYLDEPGRPYILFSRKNFHTERYYLHENGWRLEGDIETKLESKGINVR
jgi:hypothetical protein